MQRLILFKKKKKGRELPTSISADFMDSRSTANFSVRVWETTCLWKTWCQKRVWESQEVHLVSSFSRTCARLPHVLPGWPWHPSQKLRPLTLHPYSHEDFRRDPVVHVTLKQKSKEVVAPEPQLPGQNCLLVGPQVEGRVGTSVLEVETPPVPCWFKKEGHHDWPMEPSSFPGMYVCLPTWKPLNKTVDGSPSYGARSQHRRQRSAAW